MTSTHFANIINVIVVLSIAGKFYPPKFYSITFRLTIVFSISAANMCSGKVDAAKKCKTYS